MRVKALEGSFNADTSKIYVRGNFQKSVGDASDWSGSTFRATDENKDSIYAITIDFPDSLVGKSFEYKFVIDDGGWEEDPNRKFTVPAADTALPLAYYNNDSVVTIMVTNILNFTVDLSSIYGTGEGYYDPDTDSIHVEGLDWVAATVISGERKMKEDPFMPGIFTTSMEIKGAKGDSTKWKCRAFPDTKFFNTGWEVSTDKWHMIGEEGTVTDVPTFVPDIFPKKPALTEDVKILFQVNMTNALNRRLTTAVPIDPSSLQYVGLKGQDSVLGYWTGEWTDQDTVNTDTTNASLIVLNDSGINGDKSAGDYVWSGYVTFKAGTVGGPTLYKYGARYPGADTVDSFHPLDNEFKSNSELNHVVNIKVGGVTEVYNYFGNATITSVQRVDASVPEKFELCQNFPNPFNPSTTIRYSVPVAGKVCVKVFNLLGEEVRTLYNGEQNAGVYEVTFDASSLASGTYFYRLTTGESSMTKKMILIK